MSTKHLATLSLAALLIAGSPACMDLRDSSPQLDPQTDGVSGPAGGGGGVEHESAADQQGALNTAVQDVTGISVSTAVPVVSAFLLWWIVYLSHRRETMRIQKNHAPVVDRRLIDWKGLAPHPGMKQIKPPKP